MLDCDADAADRVPPSCEHRNDGWAVGRVGDPPLRGRDARATEPGGPCRAGRGGGPPAPLCLEGLPGGSGTTLQASAGADQQVTEGALVTLDATASAGSGLTYSWEQVSGTTVTLSSSTTAQPVFIAPDVTNPETLRFRVTVQDDQSNTDTDEVDITVLDSP